MYFSEDEYMARRLQNEFQAFENFNRQSKPQLNESLNPVDSKLEYIDPTPSIHDLFVKFDRKFFWNKLGMVEVVWSHRMTKCAGLCSFEGGRGLCKIALSAPLLSLRPRKDLVETLLHEMIHAYLFVTHNNKDRDDHGPEFHKHMFRINKEAGTKITVYHTFHDEVEYYQRHIWRCNGPCQKKKPYFGFVRRAINRPPGPNDPWWIQHKMECNGTFIKISEPEKKPRKNKKILVVKPTGDKCKDIRDFFNQNKTNQVFGIKTTSNIKTLADIKGKPVAGVKTNIGTGTIVVTNTNKEKRSKSKSPVNQNLVKEVHKKDLGNIKTIDSIMSDNKLVTNNNKEKQPNSKSPNNRNLVKIPHKNNTETKDSSTNTEVKEDCDKVKETVRNFWANKYPKPIEKSSPKKIKLDCPVCKKGFPEEEIQLHLKECLEKKNSKPQTSASDEYKTCPVCSGKILQSEMNDHLESCLNCSFVNEGETEKDVEVLCESVPCPCCYKWFQESEMNSHIDECLTLNALKEEFLVS